jgi:hypothetical protein
MSWTLSFQDPHAHTGGKGPVRLTTVAIPDTKPIGNAEAQCCGSRALRHVDLEYLLGVTGMHPIIDVQWSA